jgi:hypothetical protein
MSANTSPIWSGKPTIQWATADGDGGTAGPIKTANTAKDGTGTVNTIFTADATNGSYVDRIRFRPAGTNASATVVRIFINNGSSSATPANNILVDEYTCPTVTISETSSQVLLELPLQIGLPAGYKILVTIGTTIAAGLFVSAIGGHYTL